MNDVVVTGIAPISAIGIGRDAFARGMAARKCAIGDTTLFAADGPVAEVRDLNLDAILPSQKTYLDRASEFTLAAAQLALTDAGLARGAYEQWRAGVVLGSEYGCLNTLQKFTTTLQQKGARLANPLLFSHTYVNTPTSLCAIEFGLGGHHASFAGHGAGAQALSSAWEAMRLGRADVLLAIGVDVLSEPLYRALVADDAYTGEAIGEGACAFVLETAEHAAARGATGLPLTDVAADGSTLRGQIGHTFAAEPFLALAAHWLTSVAAG